MRHAPNHWRVAHARTLAAMLVGLSLTGSIAWFWSWRLPTLPGRQVDRGVARATERDEQGDVRDAVATEMSEDSSHCVTSSWS